VGASSFVIVTSAVIAGHVPLVTDQRKMFGPSVNPVTPDAGLDGFITVAPPLITLQLPVPSKTGVAPKVPVVEQII
jgi:hypothetical protein